MTTVRDLETRIYHLLLLNAGGGGAVKESRPLSFTMYLEMLIFIMNPPPHFFFPLLKLIFLLCAIVRHPQMNSSMYSEDAINSGLCA